MSVLSRVNRLERFTLKPEEPGIVCHVVDYATGKCIGVSFTVEPWPVNYRNGLQYLAPDIAPGRYKGAAHGTLENQG